MFTKNKKTDNTKNREQKITKWSDEVGLVPIALFYFVSELKI